MGISYEEAIAQITGPGGPFEITEALIRGERLRVFKNTPPSLRSLFDLARARGDQTFLVYEDESWSWAETMRHVDALAAALVHRFGVAPGDRVAIAMRNYPEWIIAFAAITSVGGVAVSLNAWWTADETDFGLRDSGSRVLVADVERVERAAATLAALGIRAIAVRSGGAALPAGAERYEDAISLGAPMPDVAIDPHADATILYTSGTTGRPKGAVSTHHAVLSALLCFGCQAAVRGLLNPETEPAEEVPDQLHPRGAAVPRHGLRRGDALVRRGGLQARDHAQVERRARARADRARADHQLRRRPDDVVGPARVARLRAARHLEPQGGRRRRRARAARARAPDRPRLPQRRSGDRLRHDRDERLRPAERGPRLPAPADELRPHGARRRDPGDRRARRARCRPARSARSGSAVRT